MKEFQGLWPTVLSQGQEEIAKYSTEYYRNVYRPQELFYWTFIPRWLAEDWAELLKRDQPLRVLDIGCAYKTLLLYARRLTRCKAYGIDAIDDYHFPEFCEKWQLKFSKCNIELSDPPWGGNFDSVIFTETIEHFNFHPISTMTRIRKLLAKDGTLYLSTPEAETCGRITEHYSKLNEIPEPSESSAQPIYDGHVWQYTKDELLSVLACAGLRVTRMDLAPGTGGRHYNLTAVSV